MIKLRAELAELNHCAVPFLSRPVLRGLIFLSRPVLRGLIFLSRPVLRGLIFLSRKVLRGLIFLSRPVLRGLIFLLSSELYIVLSNNYIVSVKLHLIHHEPFCWKNGSTKSTLKSKVERRDIRTSEISRTTHIRNWGEM